VQKVWRHGSTCGAPAWQILQKRKKEKKKDEQEDSDICI
jgi:hypothetical protein